jgi:uncharacterized protein (TIGR03118 family)
MQTHKTGTVFCAAALLAVLSAAQAASVKQTNLVSDGFVKAANTDKNLVNPWGISYSPTGDFWVSDNGTGLTTLYDGTGAVQSLVVTIPKPGGGTSGPSGQVFNGTGAFNITEGSATGSAFFIFVSEDGTISGWNPSVDPANAVTAVDNSASGAVYKGVALYTDKAGNSFLLAANFHSGFVEVYDGNFKLLTKFRDHGGAHAQPIPFNYSPFNVAVLNGHIYVSYARAKPGKHDDLAGEGHGFVDQVTFGGRLVQRIASHGPLNSPWGMAIAPSSFGPFANALLVGNFGDGHVSAYNAAKGTYLGQLPGAEGEPLEIDGLWALIPGNGGGAGSTSDLYFTAGPAAEAHGLLGSLAWMK